jgi:hypothetical protein
MTVPHFDLTTAEGRTYAMRTMLGRALRQIRGLPARARAVDPHPVFIFYPEEEWGMNMVSRGDLLASVEEEPPESWRPIDHEIARELRDAAPPEDAAWVALLGPGSLFSWLWVRLRDAPAGNPEDN